MLEGDRRKRDLGPNLESLPCCALPPEGERAFLARTGPAATDSEDRRRFARFFYRRKAVLKIVPTLPSLARPEKVAGVYLRDISKQGVGFLFDEQLFPGERCVLLIPEIGNRVIEIASCRRLAENCYAAGGRFQAPAEPNEQPVPTL